MSTRLLLLLPLLAACAGPRTGDPEVLPPPFTAAEIRAANPVGTNLLFRVEGAGGAVVHQRMRFVDCDETGAVVESVTTGADGVPRAPVLAPRRTWEELRDHAAFPPGSATRRRGSVRVPAGRFDAWLYTVRSGDVETEFAFAREHAGPPVRILETRAGEPVMRMELVSGR